MPVAEDKTVSVPIDPTSPSILQAALTDPKIYKALEGKKIIKIVVVPGRLVNIVTD
jgi:leucyl-tRNA synthetase